MTSESLVKIQFLLLKIIVDPGRTGKPLYFTRNILLVPVDPLVQITA